MTDIRTRLARLFARWAETLDPTVIQPAPIVHQQVVMGDRDLVGLIAQATADQEERIGRLHEANRQLSDAKWRAERAYLTCVPFVAILPKRKKREVEAELRTIFSTGA